jgi:hypothetical protein
MNVYLIPGCTSAPCPFPTGAARFVAKISLNAVLASWSAVSRIIAATDWP